VQEGLSELPLVELHNPVTGGPGVRVRFLDEKDSELFAEDRLATSYLWFGNDIPREATRVVEATTVWTPRETGPMLLGFAGVGHGTVAVEPRPPE
jgi:beta-glucosidase